MHLLVVEDDPRLRRLLARLLTVDRHVVEEAADADGAMELARLTDGLDAIVLDVGLPDRSGLEVARQLRAHGSSVPILMLTARDSIDDRVRGLDAGADDYLVKPFDLEELFARLRALHRRATEDEPQPLRVGDLVVDPSSRRAWRGDDEIELSAREFDILALLMSRAGRVVTRFAILEEVWDGDTDLRSNVIDVHVAALRAKIDKPFGTHTITTLRGAGYRLEGP